MSKLPEHILYRLMISKHFLNEAKSRLVLSKDEFSTSLVVVHFHDCLDNLCGAIASQLGLRLGRESYLLDLFFKVSENVRCAQSYRMEVEQLNMLRNGVKHGGIAPNPRTVIALAPVLEKFCNEISTDCFGKSLSAISLTDAIEDERLRREIQDVEKIVEGGEYKRALETMALIVFQEFERWYAVGPSGWSGAFLASLPGQEAQPPEQQVNVFPDISEEVIHRMFLGLGIEPDLYRRFHNLVPQVGYDNLRDKNVIVRKNIFVWHAKNWTEENCRFCVEFLTNFFVRRQRRYRGYKIVSRYQMQTVTFLSDSTAYSHVGGELGADLPATVQAGDIWDRCNVYDYVDGEWQNRGEETARVLVYSSTPGEVPQEFIVNKADVHVETEAERYFDLEGVSLPTEAEEDGPEG